MEIEIKEMAMTAEKYKDLIVQKLGMANDCEESKQIIIGYKQFLKEKHISTREKEDFLVGLKDNLKNLSAPRFDYTHWCNIQCAILYLRKLTNK